RVGMDLDEADAVELLARRCPVGDFGEVDDTGPAGHAHQREVAVHRVAAGHPQSYRMGDGLGVDGVGDELPAVGEGRVLPGDLGMRVEVRQGAVAGDGQLLLQLRGGDLHLAAGGAEAFDTVCGVHR